MSQEALGPQQPEGQAGNYHPDEIGRFVPEALDRAIIAVPLRRRIMSNDRAVYRVIVDFDWNKERPDALITFVTLVELAKLVSDAPEKSRLNLPKTRASQQYAFAELEGIVIQEMVRLDRYDETDESDVPPEFLPAINRNQRKPIRDAVVKQLEELRVIHNLDGRWDPLSVAGKRVIHSVWPDFVVRALLTKSLSTIKADAARASFSAFGDDITWAVVDSGIDAAHPHFHMHKNLDLDESIADAHCAFTLDGDPFKDPYGHGTHVAGIIAGEVVREDNPDDSPGEGGANGSATTETDTTELAAATASAATTAALPLGVVRRVEVTSPEPMVPVITATPPPLVSPPVRQIIAVSREVDEKRRVKRVKRKLDRISGVAPRCKLVSIKVLDENGEGDVSSLILALEHIQEINKHGRNIQIHGVNMSVGYPFEAEWFACGQSPLCVEVNRLVRSGVVVVAAAGNTGYGWISTGADGVQEQSGHDLTINDPGNAELAITVGATHRESPHIYGVSYFSSKGPTGDGRSKPDLVAPGEKIISCATGKGRSGIDADPEAAVYVEQSGTSQASPHVSGAVAAFLSIRREFIGRPEQVKEIFLSTATDLKRDRQFQGYGLVDLIRAIQSV